MYDELIDALGCGLRDLGHVCTTAINQVVPGAVNILLGSTIFGTNWLRLANRLKGAPYIVYQLEQLDASLGLLPDYPDYGDLLRGAARIWDYAPSSTAYLRARGFAQVRELAPAYHPCLERFTPRPDPDIDVLFVGSAHPRRTEIIERLRAGGAKVVHLEGCYGRQRDEALTRARIVLNMHAWDGLTMLETIRLSYLLANSCFVVSETADHDPYGGGVVYAEHRDLAATCLAWLARPAAEQRAIAERGRAALRNRPITDGLTRVQAELDLPRSILPAREDGALAVPVPVPRDERTAFYDWGREGAGFGDVLLTAGLPAELAACLAAGCAAAGRPPPRMQAEGTLRLLVLGGAASYADCRAAMDRLLGRVENCGALAIYGVGTEPGATQLHAEILRENQAIREVCRAGSLRIFVGR